MIQPVNDYLVVKPMVDTKTKGGLILVATDKSTRPDKGEVLAVGPGIYQNGIFVPNKCHVGDQIYFSQYPNFEIDIDGQRLLMVREGQVCGKMM